MSPQKRTKAYTRDVTKYTVSTKKTKLENFYHNFCRAMLCKRSLCRLAVSVCPSVRVSVTFVDHVKTNKHIIKLFSPSGSNAILVLPGQTA